MTRPHLSRAQLLRGANAALAVCLVAVLLLLVRPAWQERSRQLEALGRLEEQVASQQQIAASVAAAEAELAEVSAAVALREAELAPAGGDMAVVRAVEELAGEDVRLTLLSPGEMRPAAQDQPGEALYCELPLRVEAQGARDPLVAFLRALEEGVPGLRVHAVSLSANDPEVDSWDLRVTGVLFLLAPCD